MNLNLGSEKENKKLTINIDITVDDQMLLNDKDLIKEIKDNIVLILLDYHKNQNRKEASSINTETDKENMYIHNTIDKNDISDLTNETSYLMVLQPKSPNRLLHNNMILFISPPNELDRHNFTKNTQSLFTLRQDITIYCIKSIINSFLFQLVNSECYDIQQNLYENYLAIKNLLVIFERLNETKRIENECDLQRKPEIRNSGNENLLSNQIVLYSFQSADQVIDSVSAPNFDKCSITEIDSDDFIEQEENTDENLIKESPQGIFDAIVDGNLFKSIEFKIFYYLQSMEYLVRKYIETELENKKEFAIKEYFKLKQSEKNKQYTQNADILCGENVDTKLNNIKNQIKLDSSTNKIEPTIIIKKKTKNKFHKSLPHHFTKPICGIDPISKRYNVKCHDLRVSMGVEKIINGLDPNKENNLDMKAALDKFTYFESIFDPKKEIYQGQPSLTDIGEKERKFYYFFKNLYDDNVIIKPKSLKFKSRLVKSFFRSTKIPNRPSDVLYANLHPDYVDRMIKTGKNSMNKSPWYVIYNPLTYLLDKTTPKPFTNITDDNVSECAWEILDRVKADIFHIDAVFFGEIKYIAFREVVTSIYWGEYIDYDQYTTAELLMGLIIYIWERLGGLIPEFACEQFLKFYGENNMLKVFRIVNLIPIIMTPCKRKLLLGLQEVINLIQANSEVLGPLRKYAIIFLADHLFPSNTEASFVGENERIMLLDILFNINLYYVPEWFTTFKYEDEPFVWIEIPKKRSANKAIYE